MSLSTSSPQAFDPSLLLPEEPSQHFQSLARILNFNLPLKLEKTNYSILAATLLALVNCFINYSWSIIQLFNATKDLTKIDMVTLIRIPYSNQHS
ncbi:hypothetical protein ACOSQ4_014188 [Xanthoceras sorbifolium]